VGPSLGGRTQWAVCASLGLLAPCWTLRWFEIQDEQYFPPFHLWLQDGKNCTRAFSGSFTAYHVLENTFVLLKLSGFCLLSVSNQRVLRPVYEGGGEIINCRHPDWITAIGRQTGRPTARQVAGRQLGRYPSRQPDNQTDRNPHRRLKDGHRQDNSHGQSDR
jgi:hypothetical protein